MAFPYRVRCLTIPSVILSLTIAAEDPLRKRRITIIGDLRLEGKRKCNPKSRSFLYAQVIVCKLSKAILKSFMCFILSISESRIFQKSITHSLKLLFLSEFSTQHFFQLREFFRLAAFFWVRSLGLWHRWWPASLFLASTSHSPNSLSLLLSHCCPFFLLISLIAFLWTLFPSTTVLFRK